MSNGRAPSRGRARRHVDGRTAGRTLLRGADPRMAELVDAQPFTDCGVGAYVIPLYELTRWKFVVRRYSGT